MNIKRRLIRNLLHRLPPDDQERMVADVIAWLYAELLPAERQEKIQRLGPRLLAMIQQGRLGLPLLIYYHLLRRPRLRWLARWAMPMSKGCHWTGSMEASAR